MKPTDGKESAPPAVKGAEKAPPKPGPETQTPVKDDALLAKVKSLEEERDRLKAEMADARDKYLRARADYENHVRRTQKDTLEAARSARGRLLLRIVGLAETLEKAVVELDKTIPAAGRGVKLAYEEFRKLLKDEGLREIEAVGHDFNYKFHQAVERVETADKPEGTILDVIQRGYTMEGDILRPALVRVAVPARKTSGKQETASTA